MDHVSRPMQILLIATLAFAAVWFVALRPKGTKTVGPPAPAAVAQPAADAAPAPAVPAATPAPAPRAATPPVKAAVPAPKPAAPQAAKRRPARPEPAGASPDKIRRAMARGHAVVLLFYSRSGADDRRVRSELAGVSRRGGRVQAWAVSVRGLSRFKNVLAGAQILQSPSVLVLSPRGRLPVLLPGYTDRAEIDQITAAALRPPTG